MSEKPPEVVIPREKAVFWLDDRGYWRNEGGKFRKKKIIDYFHRAIDKDDGGYHVVQDKGGVIEKVYFPYEDTALFAFDAEIGDDILLLLNTGRELRVLPENLFIPNDSLYAETPGHRIKFSERAMMKIARCFEEAEGGTGIRIRGKLHPVAEKPPVFPKAHNQIGAGVEKISWQSDFFVLICQISVLYCISVTREFWRAYG